MQASRTRLAIITGREHPELLEDGQALQDALRDRDIQAEPAVWRDESVAWDVFDAAIIRSCFEYYRQPAAFRDWLTTLEDAGVTVLNPPELVRWNMHKFYLRDLAEEGISVLATSYVEAESETSLQAVLDRNNWTDAIIKPAIGTSSAGVWRTSSGDAAGHQQRFEECLADGDLLVQRFAPEVADGERSLVFFGGEYSYASNHIPAEDDFRSHHRFGGRSERYEPSGTVIEQARGVLDAVERVLDIDQQRLPYARVDGIERDGDFVLMEAELIEPYLGHERRDATDRFVTAVCDALAVS